MGVVIAEVIIPNKNPGSIFREKFFHVKVPFSIIFARYYPLAT